MNLDNLKKAASRLEEELIVLKIYVEGLEDRESNLKDTSLQSTKKLEDANVKLAEVLKINSKTEINKEEITERKNEVGILITKKEERAKEIDIKQEELDKSIEKLTKLKEKAGELEAKKQKLEQREKEVAENLDLIKKEKVVARDRQIILDKREKSMEIKEARLKRFSNV